METPLRLVIIGAGALTEGVYLPVLKNNKLFKVTCLVDSNLPQAEKLAAEFQVGQVLKNAADIDASKVDAALVVLPNFLHASVSLLLLDKGIPVLVEKPMANTTEECHRLIEKCKATNKVLAVGLVRRFYPTTQFIRTAVQDQLFGKLIRFDFQEGHVFEWKLQSDYLLSHEKAGGGVLMDTGIHMLDQLIYCIGMPDDIAYYDDNQGGVEADCLLKVRIAAVQGTLAFSRIRSLRNSMILYFEQATLEVGLNAHSEVSLQFKEGLSIKMPILKDGQVIKNKDAFNKQLNDFAEAITTGKPCKISGEEGILSLQVVEKCYSSRQPIQNNQTVF